MFDTYIQIWYKVNMKKHSKFSADNKAKLDQAFKALRKLGYVAKQNYLCCSSCAGAQIAHDIRNMSLADRAKVKGCVFYHKQGGDSMRDYGRFMLHFGPVKVDNETIGSMAWACGIDACRALGDAGLKFEWNQKPDSCIEVIND